MIQHVTGGPRCRQVIILAAMQFHVLGLGSIGQLFAHHLRRITPTQHSVTLIHKSRSAAEEFLAHGNLIRVERNGIVLTSSGFKVDAFDIPSSDIRTANGPDPKYAAYRNFDEPIDSLFVTTKAHQAVRAIIRLAPRLSADSTITLFQNGMGIYEELSNRLFPTPELRPHFILASNTHGVFIKNTYHVVHTGLGKLEFGIIQNPARSSNFEASYHDESVSRPGRRLQLNDITTSQDPEFKRYRSLRDTVAVLLLLDPLHSTWKPMREMQITLRRKLVVDAIINSLTAIMGCRNGDLFVSPNTRRIVRVVCREASYAFSMEFQLENKRVLETLAAQGVDTSTIDVARFPQQLTCNALENEVLEVVRATGGNISSMLSDIRTGRPTEIDYINGFLLEFGNICKVRMPITKSLLQLVKMRSEIPLDQQL